MGYVADWKLRTGKMAHDERNAVFLPMPRCDVGDVVHRKAETIHPGVDMQRHSAAPAGRGAKRRPLVELDAAADHRPQI